MSSNKFRNYLFSGVGVLFGVAVSQNIQAQLNKQATSPAPAQTIAVSDNEEPAWVNYAASRMCTYLKRGLSPYKAGFEGMKDVVESDQHAGAAIRAHNNLGKNKASVMAATAAMKKCPDALIKATRNHTGA